jgi:hypothetical protein
MLSVPEHGALNKVAWLLLIIKIKFNRKLRLISREKLKLVVQNKISLTFVLL